jgi:hypothetical protein
MFSMRDHVQRATSGWGLALAAVTLLLSVLVHFSADLTWLSRHATAQVTAQSMSIPLSGSSERLSLGDPDDTVALVPRAASVPRPSTIAVRGMLAPNDRMRPPLPLFHPPALNSNTLLANL